jgi:hypothetical protein
MRLNTLSLISLRKSISITLLAKITTTSLPHLQFTLMANGLILTILKPSTKSKKQSVIRSTPHSARSLAQIAQRAKLPKLREARSQNNKNKAPKTAPKNSPKAVFRDYISMYSFQRSASSTRSVPLRLRFFMVFSCLLMYALNDLLSPINR